MALKQKKETPKKETSKKSNSAEMQRLLDSINKKFGDNAVTLGVPSGDNEVIKRIPTGSVALDVALGGGIPVGRYTEISGGLSTTKSTQCAHIIRNAQKMGYKCAFIDVEATTTKAYLRACGVDTDELIYSRPVGLEEATQIVLDLESSGLVQLAVIDSTAALSPTKEQDSKMEESVQMGLVPKLLGEFFRKYQAFNNKLVREGSEPFTLICVNQLREKIGSYGNPEYCLHYDTKIPLVDGRCLPIGEIVKNKIQGQVWALNEKTGEFEAKDIVDWRDNGVIDTDDEYYHIESKGIGSRNGRFGITVTYDHKVLTDTGWKPAQDITMADKLITRYQNYINGTLGDFLYGTLSGDSTLYSTHKNSNTALLRLQDSVNPEYAEWKVNKLNALMPFKKTEGKSIWHSKPSVQLMRIKKSLPQRDPYYFISRHFSYLGMAVWYMDDGCLDTDSSAMLISVKRFAKYPDRLQRICDALGQLGIVANFRKDGLIRIDSSSSALIFEQIKTYIPECMQYKLPDKYKGYYTDFELHNNPQWQKEYSQVISVRLASKKQLKKRHRYDIKVDGYHNFLAGGTINGVVVHNTPGGRANGFVQSVAIRFRRGDWIVQGTGTNKEIIGQVVKFKIEKNKTYRRNQEGSFDFYYSENEAGVTPNYNDNNKSIIMLGVEWGIIERKGAWFYYADNKYQGIPALVKALSEDENLFEKLKNEVMERVISK